MSSPFTTYGFSEQLISELYQLGHQYEVPMGQSVYIYDDDNPSYAFLLSGRLRHLVDHPDPSATSFTLAFYRAPFIAGISSFNCRSNVEELYASEDSSLIKIQISDFDSLYRRFPELKAFLNSSLTAADVWPILLNVPQFHVDPQASIFRLRIDNILKASVTYIVDPDNPFSISPSEERAYFSLSRLYHCYGAPISTASLSTIHTSVDQPIRLVSFPQELLFSHPKVSDVPAISSSYNPQSSVETNLTNDSTQVPFNDESVDYPFRFFSSPHDKVLEAIAIIRTIGDQLNLPLKLDLLKRFIEDQVSNKGTTVSLSLCSAIFESLGLKTQLLNLPSHLFSRITAPCVLLLKDDELAVLLAVKSDKFLISRPLYGISSFSQRELSDLSQNPDILSILTLAKTHRTPQKRFTFKWFFPVLKKHKKSLIEVLVASFFVQIFDLMNPLIIQQIIDKVIGQNAMSTLPVLAVLLFSFSVFENILTAVRTNLFIDTTNRIDITLGELVIDHLLRLPLNYFDKRPVGELSSRLGEMEQIRSFLTGTALTVIIDSVFSLLYIIVMLFYSWVLTIVSLLVAPILAFITFSISPIIRSQLRSKANLNALTQNHLIEVLTGIQTVKAQNFELHARWRWKQRYSDYVAQGLKMQLLPPLPMA